VVRAVAVGPGNQHIVSASSDQTVRVWDLRSGRLVRTLEGHSWSAPAVAVAVSPDNQHIVSAGGQASIERVAACSAPAC
jgi:WD40 repeat protein